MSGRLGPEARLALDGLLGGQRVNCQVFGKTAQGDAVGQCLAGTVDPAETLLGKGFAAVYRNGNGNDADQQALAEKYDAAETLARKQGWASGSRPHRLPIRRPAHMSGQSAGSWPMPPSPC